jgi:hypothetical protein
VVACGHSGEPFDSVVCVGAPAVFEWILQRSNAQPGALLTAIDRFAKARLPLTVRIYNQSEPAGGSGSPGSRSTRMVRRKPASRR